MVDAVGSGGRRGAGSDSACGSGRRPTSVPRARRRSTRVVPARRVVSLPDDASFDLGASLGVPFLTAHRCLTVTEERAAPPRPGHSRRSHRARRRWCRRGWQRGHPARPMVGRHGHHHGEQPGEGAARRGGRRRPRHRLHAAGRASEIRKIAPDGVHTVVEVSPAQNAAIDAAVLAPTRLGGDLREQRRRRVSASRSRTLMVRNARWQFVLMYTAPAHAMAEAVEGRHGRAAGPRHPRRTPRRPSAAPLLADEAAAAHAAVERGVVGKVLIDVAD